MTEHFNFMKCTFTTLIVAGVIFIFIAIQLEEGVHDYNIHSDESNFKPLPKPKRKPQVVSRVQLPVHNQEDPELVKDLASKLIPPCLHITQYRIKKAEKSQIGKYLKKLLNNKLQAFFFECGASDGVSFSNTLFLEKHLYWKGLLVEADPLHMMTLFSVYRKAWIAPVCMSLNNSAYIAFFKSSPSFDGRVLQNHTNNHISEENEEDTVQVVCYPFYTFVLALNITRIDYLSLNVEGDELEILKTVPFDKVDIGIVSVDFSKTRGGFKVIKTFMEGHGYDLIKEFPSSELLFININEN